MIFRMELLNRYFGNLVFYKVDEREHYTLYAADVTAGHTADNKSTYVVVFVPHYYAKREKAYLRELAWHNLQTRFMRDPYKIPRQKWTIPRDVQDVMFRVQHREKQHTIYSPETPLPLEMLLLHDPKKQSLYQHNNRVGLVGSLLSFRCVLNYLGDIREPPPGPSPDQIGVTPIGIDPIHARQAPYTPSSRYAFEGNAAAPAGFSVSGRSSWSGPPPPERIEGGGIEFLPPPE